MKIGYLYFMFRRKKLVYIGATKNIVKRMQWHLCYLYFDSLRVIECDLEKMNEYEIRLIKRFKPECNTMHHWPKKRKFLYHIGTKNKRKRIWEYEVMHKYLPQNGYIMRRLKRTATKV